MNKPLKTTENRQTSKFEIQQRGTIGMTFGGENIKKS
jgi:hypothetical protein